MALDIETIAEWARYSLRLTVDDLTDEELTKPITSVVRILKASYPVLVENGTADFSGLEPEDKDGLYECIGWLVAANWVRMPRPDGEEIVKSLKIGQIQESYEVRSVEDLVSFFLEMADNCFDTISFIGTSGVASHELGKDKIKLFRANPVREAGANNPSSVGTLIGLFIKPNTEFSGDSLVFRGV